VKVFAKMPDKKSILFPREKKEKGAFRRYLSGKKKNSFWHRGRWGGGRRGAEGKKKKGAVRSGQSPGFVAGVDDGKPLLEFRLISKGRASTILAQRKKKKGDFRGGRFSDPGEVNTNCVAFDDVGNVGPHLRDIAGGYARFPVGKRKRPIFSQGKFPLTRKVA